MTLDDIQNRNRELAHQINEETLNNPDSPYASKFVGLIDGRVADGLDELGNASDELHATPENSFCVEAGLNYEEPQYIWSA